MREGDAFPPSEEGREILGDVVISLDTAARQARRRRVALIHETAYLIIHGVLHLLGRDDSTRSGFLSMKRKQDAIFKSLVERGVLQGPVGTGPEKPVLSKSRNPVS
jgi:rRNA maturation RNase YbeY